MFHRGRQLTLFGGFVATNALLVFVAFALRLPKQFMAGREIPEPFASMPGRLLGLANAGMVFVLSGIVGIVAGERYVQEGLIAAVGIHFWTDVAKAHPVACRPRRIA